MTYVRSLEEWLRLQTTQNKLNLALANIDRTAFPLAHIIGLRSPRLVATALDLCLLCWYRTDEQQCPKIPQISSALSLLRGRDTFLYAGTGFGKTLSAILHAFLERRHGITIIITPMKRIQASHVRIYPLSLRFKQD